MLREILLKASASETLARRLPRYRFVRAAVSRFMPGEEVDDALAAARAYAGGPEAQPPIGAVLSHLGENVATRDDALRAADQYESALNAIASETEPSHISVKLTHLGLDVDRQLADAHLDRIARRAAEIGASVWIDMESSAYVDMTLDVFRGALRTHANLGLCLQAYLHRTPDDLESVIDRTCAIRLVKGAYAEPPEVALQDKREVDRAFHDLAVRLIEAAASRRSHESAPVLGSQEPPPVLGSHDSRLIDTIVTAVERKGVERDAYEVQMLYGIRTAELRRLAARGHRARVFICYGPEWFPWFVRRIAEKPANLWFVARQILPF